MKKRFSRSRILFYVIIILAIVGYRYYQQKEDEAERKAKIESAINQTKAQQKQQQDAFQNVYSDPGAPPADTIDQTGRIASISELTNEEVVINYVRENGKLPDYYMTKKEAQEKGWEPSEANLCDVLPGKAIGGDLFNNFEANLPKKEGRQYIEADLNYNCGQRNSTRLIFSNDGLIYTTKDHYKTFTKR